MTKTPPKNLSSKEKYQKAKWPIIYLTKSQTEQAVLKDTSPDNADLFHLDDQGTNPVHYDAEKLCLDNRTKQAA